MAAARAEAPDQSAAPWGPTSEGTSWTKAHPQDTDGGGCADRRPKNAGLVDAGSCSWPGDPHQAGRCAAAGGGTGQSIAAGTPAGARRAQGRPARDSTRLPLHGPRRQPLRPPTRSNRWTPEPPPVHPVPRPAQPQGPASGAARDRRHNQPAGHPRRSATPCTGSPQRREPRPEAVPEAAGPAAAQRHDCKAATRASAAPPGPSPERRQSALQGPLQAGRVGLARSSPHPKAMSQPCKGRYKQGELG